ncbi:MAG: pantetheine-phosphate adenylyltransferase [Microcystis panniformis]
MSKRALYPGSFDPITKGHEDIIRRASVLFDHVTVAVAKNISKLTPLFSFEEKVAFIEHSIHEMGLTNVTVAPLQGLTAQFAQQQGYDVIIRGLRVISDFEYECSMYQANRQLAPSVDSLFLMPALEYQFLSSRMVREIATFEGDVSSLVSPHVHHALLQRLHEQKTAGLEP